MQLIAPYCSPQAVSAMLQEDAGGKRPQTEGALNDAVEAIRRSFPGELAGGLPQGHPLQSVLMGTQPAREAAVSAHLTA